MPLSPVHFHQIIRETLQPIASIEFALLFGSVAQGTQTALSDLDVGVHFKEEVSLLQIGAIISALESKLRKDVDVLELNNLYKRRPAMAYEIVAKGKLVFCRNEDSFVDFKRRTFLYYLDTKPLRDMVNAALLKRIASGRFGRFNYAG